MKTLKQINEEIEELEKKCTDKNNALSGDVEDLLEYEKLKALKTQTEEIVEMFRIWVREYGLVSAGFQKEVDIFETKIQGGNGEQE